MAGSPSAVSSRRQSGFRLQGRPLDHMGCRLARHGGERAWSRLGSETTAGGVSQPPTFDTFRAHTTTYMVKSVGSTTCLDPTDAANRASGAPYLPVPATAAQTRYVAGVTMSSTAYSGMRRRRRLREPDPDRRLAGWHFQLSDPRVLRRERDLQELPDGDMDIAGRVEAFRASSLQVLLLGRRRCPVAAGYRRRWASQVREPEVGLHHMGSAGDDEVLRERQSRHRDLGPHPRVRGRARDDPAGRQEGHLRRLRPESHEGGGRRSQRDAHDGHRVRLGERAGEEGDRSLRLRVDRAAEREDDGLRRPGKARRPLDEGSRRSRRIPSPSPGPSPRLSTRLRWRLPQFAKAYSFGAPVTLTCTVGGDCSASIPEQLADVKVSLAYLDGLGRTIQVRERMGGSGTSAGNPGQRDPGAELRQRTACPAPSSSTGSAQDKGVLEPFYSSWVVPSRPSPRSPLEAGAAAITTFDVQGRVSCALSRRISRRVANAVACTQSDMDDATNEPRCRLTYGFGDLIGGVQTMKVTGDGGECASGHADELRRWGAGASVVDPTLGKTVNTYDLLGQARIVHPSRARWRGPADGHDDLRPPGARDRDRGPQLARLGPAGVGGGRRLRARPPDDGVLLPRRREKAQPSGGGRRRRDHCGPTSRPPTGVCSGRRPWR